MYRNASIKMTLLSIVGIPSSIVVTVISIMNLAYPVHSMLPAMSVLTIVTCLAYQLLEVWGLMRSKRIRSGILLMCSCLCIEFAMVHYGVYYKNLGPYDFLENKFGLSESYLQPEEILFESTVDGQKNEHLLVYKNANETLTCSLLKKGFFTYKVLDISSEIGVPKTHNDINMLFSSFEKATRWIGWGCYINPDIVRVEIGQQNANLYDANGEFTVFFILGAGELTEEGTAVQYYDINNELILLGK